jgi:hypothetical protein
LLKKGSIFATTKETTNSYECDIKTIRALRICVSAQAKESFVWLISRSYMGRRRDVVKVDGFAGWKFEALVIDRGSEL